MKFHVFRNNADSSLYALTGDKAGESLPVDYPKSSAEWTYWNSFEGGQRGRMAFGLDDEAAVQADIEEQGYYLHQWPAS